MQNHYTTNVVCLRWGALYTTSCYKVCQWQVLTSKIFHVQNLPIFPPFENLIKYKKKQQCSFILKNNCTSHTLIQIEINKNQPGFIYYSHIKWIRRLIMWLYRCMMGKKKSMGNWSYYRNIVCITHLFNSKMLLCVNYTQKLNKYICTFIHFEGKKIRYLWKKTNQVLCIKNYKLITFSLIYQWRYGFYRNIKKKLHSRQSWTWHLHLLIC